MAASDERVIFEAMQVLDKIFCEGARKGEPVCLDDHKWRPTSEEGRRAFRALTSPSNRKALRQWFNHPTLNYSSAKLCFILEDAIGESLIDGELVQEEFCYRRHEHRTVADQNE